MPEPVYLRDDKCTRIDVMQEMVNGAHVLRSSELFGDYVNRPDGKGGTYWDRYADNISLDRVYVARNIASEPEEFQFDGLREEEFWHGANSPVITQWDFQIRY